MTLRETDVVELVTMVLFSRGQVARADVKLGGKKFHVSVQILKAGAGLFTVKMLAKMEHLMNREDGSFCFFKVRRT